MPTGSKPKQDPKKKAVEKKQRRAAFLAWHPHRSFQLTRRRDYVRPIELPGLFAFTGEVTKTLWRFRKTFLLLAAVYALLYGVLVGVQSQDTYTTLSETLKSTSGDFFSGNWGAIGEAGILFLSFASSGLSSDATESQQIFSVLVFLLVWLTTVWLLRNLLAGHKVKLRDGLYNAGAPLFATAVVALIIAVQLIPIALALVGYNAATASGLLNGGASAMLFWLGASLLGILSIFWITSSIFALIIITLPGTYPLRALRTSGEMVLGRRVKILTRWAWMALVIMVTWAVVIIPIVLLDMGLKSLIPAIQAAPIVPVAIVIMAALSTVWVAAYVYLLYRKVVDYAPQS